MTDTDAIKRADEIRNILKTQRVSVSFYKADGTLRDMVCLSYAEILPNELPSGKSRSSPPTLVTVYEENNGFRSFHAQSVVSFTPMGSTLKTRSDRSRLGFAEWLVRRNQAVQGEGNLLRMI
jgi:hypothetical protein